MSQPGLARRPPASRPRENARCPESKGRAAACNKRNAGGEDREGGREIRNPKSEIRSKSKIRNPKRGKIYPQSTQTTQKRETTDGTDGRKPESRNPRSERNPNPEIRRNHRRLPPPAPFPLPLRSLCLLLFKRKETRNSTGGHRGSREGGPGIHLPFLVSFVCFCSELVPIFPDLCVGPPREGTRPATEIAAPLPLSHPVDLSISSRVLRPLSSVLCPPPHPCHPCHPWFPFSALFAFFAVKVFSDLGFRASDFRPSLRSLCFLLLNGSSAGLGMRFRLPFQPKLPIIPPE
jgi:hypothetical protein